MQEQRNLDTLRSDIGILLPKVPIINGKISKISFQRGHNYNFNILSLEMTVL